MNRINYGRHFMILSAAAGFMLFFDRIATMFPDGYAVHAYFASAGLLHAMALVVSLRIDESLLRRCVFVGLAVAASVVTPWAGLVWGGLIVGLGFPKEMGLFSVIIAASAGGACAYWFMAHILLFRTFAVSSLLRTVCACVIGTLAAMLLPRVGISAPLGALATILWWTAFSGSLFLSDRKDLANTRLHADRPSRLSPLQGGG
jgi:hypothetical protein